MSIFAKLSDSELRQTLKNLVAAERRHFLVVVDHLAELDSRSLFLRLGFSSLWEYCTRELLLKDGTAHIRITLARLIRKRPEIREFLADGRLGQCAATLLLEFADAEDFANHLEAATRLSKRDLADFLAVRRGKAAPQRDVIRRMPTQPAIAPRPMFEAPPSPVAPAPVAPPVAVQEKSHRISFSASEELVEKLKRAQDLAGSNDLEKVLGDALNAYLEKNDPERREGRREKRREQKAAAAVAVEKKEAKKEPRQHPRPIKDAVLVRDQHSCTFVGPDGVKCGARRHLHIDHIRPFSLGGKTLDEGNARVLCAGHNLLLARETFGNKVPRRGRAAPLRGKPITAGRRTPGVRYGQNQAVENR